MNQTTNSLMKHIDTIGELAKPNQHRGREHSRQDRFAAQKRNEHKR